MYCHPSGLVFFHFHRNIPDLLYFACVSSSSVTSIADAVSNFVMIVSFVVTDGFWHQECLDLGSQVRNTLFAEGVSLSSVHRVLSVRFEAPAGSTLPLEGSLYIDEFTVTSLVRCCCGYALHMSSYPSA